MRLLTVVSGVVMITTLWPAPANAATGIDCMNSGFTLSQQSLLDHFKATVASEGFNGRGRQQLAKELAAHAMECATNHGWSARAMVQALLYKVSSTAREGFEAHSLLNPAQLSRLESAAMRADQVKLRGLIGKMSDPSSSLSDDDADFLLNMMKDVGLPDDARYGEDAGQWLAVFVIAQMSLEQFAQL